MTTTCHYCAAPVDATDGLTFVRVQGWERKSLDPTRRGGSDISLREHLHLFACSTCIDRLRSGLSVGQEALL